MQKYRSHAGVWLLLLCPWLPAPAAAQAPVSARADVLLYGGNTEFRNPFREGETIFGAAARLAIDIGVGERATLSLGAFGNQRFGSEDAFDLARPVIAVTIRGRRSAFTFGTLPFRHPPLGPDRGGPHTLLPPLQRETLAFERPYEAGLEWTFTGDRLRHDVWLEWQRLNTSAHRERFDGGLNAALALSSALSLPAQVHVVHEGGQLYASGPVADSAAAAAGIDVHGRVRRIDRASLELYGLISRYVPDRARPELSRDGIAFFGRAAAEAHGWRGHVIFWRGRNYIKDEGDANYLSVTRDGRRYRGTRDYAEAGVSRRFVLSPGAAIDVSGRLHRVEGAYEYSYRVLAVVSASGKVR